MCLKILRSNCTRRVQRLCYVSLHSHSQPLSPLLACITEDENPDLPFTGLCQLEGAHVTQVWPMRCKNNSAGLFQERFPLFNCGRNWESFAVLFFPF